MTLIIGYLCSDGIVMGADGAATLGSFGQLTARQPTEKLEIIDNALIFGFSGTVGLGQRLRGCIELMWNERMKAKHWDHPVHQVMETLRCNLWRFIEPEYRASATAQQCIGPAAASTARCQAILAAPIQKGLHLIQFDHQASPEYATEKLPFMAIGIGQAIADPFLAFLRQIFWKDRSPTLAEGIFTALWTLEHAVRVNPGGIGEPIQIAVMQKDGTGSKARLLSDAELLEQRGSIQRVEEHLRSYRRSHTESVPPENVPPLPRKDE